MDLGNGWDFGVLLELKQIWGRLEAKVAHFSKIKVQ